MSYSPLSSSRRTATAGFSLVEILVVISIMAVLFGLGASAFRGMSGVNLSTSAVQVQSVLTKARQVALSNNKYTQVRFYRNTTSSTPGYHAIAIFVGDSPFYEADEAGYNKLMASKRFRQEGQTEFLPDTLSIAEEAEASKLLNLLKADTTVKRTGRSKLRNADHDWVAFYFRPNGATDFQEVKTSGAPEPLTPAQSYFTLVPTREYMNRARDNNSGDNTLSANFATFTVSSANGALNMIRP